MTEKSPTPNPTVEDLLRSRDEANIIPGRTEQPAPETVPIDYKSLILKYLNLRDTDFLLDLLDKNGYGIFNKEKLTFEVNFLRQSVLHELAEKFVFVKKEEWTNIRAQLDMINAGMPFSGAKVEELKP